MKEPCRFCAEPVEVGVAKCPHCGETLLDEGGGGAPPAKTATSVILIVVVVALVGFCAFVGIAAAIAIPNLVDARKHGNEAAAIGALKTIGTAQVLFREGDKDDDRVLDYGSLQDLNDAFLIDSVLGSGVKQGYAFQVVPSPQTPEFLWMATADPVLPGKTGDRYFMINHEGIIYYSNTAPFTITPDCATPADATPLGR